MFTVLSNSGANLLPVVANDTDPDGDALFVSDATFFTPSGGTVTIAGNQGVFYTPNANFRGTETFDYVVSDGRGGAARATITVTVLNQGLTAIPDAVSVAQGSSANPIEVLANDTDPEGDTLTVLSVGAPQDTTQGTVTVAPGGRRVLYTPRPGFSGTDRLTYTIRDQFGATASGTVTVTVVAPPVTPPPAPVDATAPSAVKARGSVATIAGIAINAPGAVVSVRVTTTRGKLTAAGGGLRVTGNKTRALSFSGPVDAVNQLLARLKLDLGARKVQARVTVSATVVVRGTDLAQIVVRS